MIPKRDVIKRIKSVLEQSKEPLGKAEICKRAMLNLTLCKNFQNYLDELVKKGVIKKINIKGIERYCLGYNENITFEEHEIIGMICKMLNYKLLKSISKHKYTKAEERKCHEIKANNFLSNFKDNMEEIMFKDYPELLKRSSKETLSIYYGDRDKSGDIIKFLRNHLDIKNKEKEKAMEIFDTMSARIPLIFENYKNLRSERISDEIIKADIKLQKLFFNRKVIDTGGIYFNNGNIKN